MANLNDLLLYELFGSKAPEYPYRWICRDCGVKYGKSRGTTCTVHIGKCDMCLEEKIVTSPRKFCWPMKGEKDE